MAATIAFEEEAQLAEPSANIVWIGLGSGTLAGAANVLIGHPFDTTKVRMQVTGTGIWQTTSQLIRSEGARAFYSGVRPALANVPLIYAAYFGAYEFGKWLQGVGPAEQPTLRQSFLAGALSGIPVCVFLTPAELLKCRLQVEGIQRAATSSSSSSTSSGPIRPTKTWELLRSIVQTEGVRGLYRGNLVTAFREIPSGAAIYVAYDMAKNNIDNWFGPMAVTPLLCGAIGGIATTVVSFPQDVVKTRVQVDAAKPSMVQVAKQVFQRQGFSGFWRGFMPAVTRAVLVESVTFLVYEFGKDIFGYEAK